ncbi:hypothetical protein Z946_2915 [Sulfitobacter noctilucicola]|uniref:Uncharacterized protein n=1 Tax=Sulfitobacter noctilucicola TaxID=1342301 RepID=A0A7W6Q6Z9_9RHOB|nr:hypothetical protein [Sulfitobacter noctilucicola]KIN64031.1 hypothetical protein Z946_2915 [Sulfitobacter noctilucicola]MBB4175387.1 hypothetical protein [Sulfitobacter noctilucicola]
MFDLVFALIAAGMNGAPSTAPEVTAAASAAQMAGSPTVQIAPNSVVIGQGVVKPTTPAPLEVQSTQGDSFNMAVVPPGLVADPQVPSGKFTTAAEVKPILSATKGNWVAIREYEGQDWLYITHLWAWRCGLKAIAISINQEPMQNWPVPDCHEKYTTPNAVLEGDGLPYLTLKLGGVQTVTIQIVYDDLSMDVAQFERGNILIP